MTEDEFDELEQRLRREHATDADPTELLTMICQMNYDGSGAFVDFLMALPTLQPAHAQALYWYLSPGYYQAFAAEADVPSVNRPSWARLRAIEARFADGSLAEATIGWDPANDLSSPTGVADHPGYDWTGEAMSVEDGAKWQIPAALVAPTPGDQPDTYAYAEERGWDEGLPPTALAVLEEAYEQLDD